MVLLSVVFGWFVWRRSRQKRHVWRSPLSLASPRIEPIGLARLCRNMLLPATSTRSFQTRSIWRWRASSYRCILPFHGGGVKLFARSFHFSCLDVTKMKPPCKSTSESRNCSCPGICRYEGPGARSSAFTWPGILPSYSLTRTQSGPTRTRKLLGRRHDHDSDHDAGPGVTPGPAAAAAGGPH